MFWSEETRKVERVAIKIPVTIKVDSSMEKEFILTQKELHTYTVDLSATGIGIISNVYIPEGVLLKIILSTQEIYPEKGKGDNYIKLEGEVVSCRMQGGQYRLSILIKQICPEDKSAIIKILGAT